MRARRDGVDTRLQGRGEFRGGDGGGGGGHSSSSSSSFPFLWGCFSRLVFLSFTSCVCPFASNTGGVTRKFTRSMRCKMYLAGMARG